jgi:hypothetical protein
VSQYQDLALRPWQPPNRAADQSALLQAHDIHDRAFPWVFQVKVEHYTVTMLGPTAVRIAEMDQDSISVEIKRANPIVLLESTIQHLQ